MLLLVDEIPTYYRDEGKGKVLLMLHGWDSDLTTFNELSTWASSKYRVVRPDLPGFGKTPLKTEEGWGLDDYVEFIDKFLKKLDIKDVEVIFGHSMGGRIAIRGVSTKRLIPKRLVLLSSHGVVEDDMRNGFWKIVAKAGKVATLMFPESVKDNLRMKLYGQIGASDYVLADKSQKATFKKLIAQDVRKDAEKITLPTLIIYGSEDKETPPRYGEYFHAAIQGSKLWIIRGAGHYVHKDAFSKVVARFREFMQL